MICCLCVMVGGLASYAYNNDKSGMRELIQNNTTAMKEVVAAVKTLTDKVNVHDVKIAEHDLRLKICEEH